MTRFLVIAPSFDVLNQIDFCIARIGEDIQLERYDPIRGLPNASFAWNQYALVLIDLELGLDDQNGYHWLKELKQVSGRPPIVSMTDKTSDVYRDRALYLGADDHINKDDLSPNRLKQCIESLVKTGDDPATSSDQIPLDETQVLVGDKTQVLAGRWVTEGHRVESIEQSVPRTKASTSPRRSGAFATKKPAAAPSVVVSVPGYRVDRKIAEGGQASIYLAERDEDGTKVILKVLYILGDGEQDTLKRFMREYQLIGKLDHPNVARIYERAFSSDFAYIAMEYFPGGDLKARIKKGIPAKKTSDYMRQIAKGLGAAHAIGIIHRDMKPGNILFRDEDRLAVTDFGLAKSLEDSKGSLTKSGSLLGTFYYVSPEQINSSEADVRSDMYSLGIMYFQMLTGIHPYRRRSASELLQAHLNDPIPRLPEPMAAFQAVIDGLLAKDPDERFQNTEELLVGLDWKS